MGAPQVDRGEFTPTDRAWRDVGFVLARIHHCTQPPLQARLAPESWTVLRPIASQHAAPPGPCCLSICLIAQGSKRVLRGDDVYDAHHFLITPVDFPFVAQVTEADQEKPYLSLILKLDRQEMSQLIADCNRLPPPAQQSSRGMTIGQVTLPQLTDFQRLIDLLPSHKTYRFWGRSLCGKSCAVYLWASKVRICDKWRRQEVRANKSRRPSVVEE